METTSSSLTWLAHSESERRQTQEVMRKLDEPGTLDEIGVGRIRDAIAGLLFPGTSTLHTRARYFLFIPWLYQELEGRSPLKRPAEDARSREIRLIDALKRQRELDDGALVEGREVDDAGIIGEVAGRDLTQLPSEAYWNALNIWGVRGISGSRSTYHRMLGRFDLRRPAVDDDGEQLAGTAGTWWDRDLPDRPKDLLQCTTMALNAEESRYLRQLATTRIPDSALAQLLDSGASLPAAAGVWDLPTAALDALSIDNRNLIELAERFSLIVLGAALLYNLMIAEQAGRDDHLAKLGERLSDWQQEIAWVNQGLRRWREEIDRFWAEVARGNPRVPSPRESHFVMSWTDIALSTADVRRSQDARDLIELRERQTKGGLGRLGNRSRLENWSGPSGDARLVFRWPNADRLIADMNAGLGIVEE